MEDLILGLRTLEKTLENRKEFLYRLSLSELVWINQFDGGEQVMAALAWKEMFAFCKANNMAPTFLFADILEGNSEFPLLGYFTHYEDRLETVCRFIVEGNSLTEEALPEKAKQAALTKASKIITKHILESL